MFVGVLVRGRLHRRGQLVNSCLSMRAEVQRALLQLRVLFAQSGFVEHEGTRWFNIHGLHFELTRAGSLLANVIPVRMIACMVTALSVLFRFSVTLYCG